MRRNPCKVNAGFPVAAQGQRPEGRFSEGTVCSRNTGENPPTINNSLLHPTNTRLFHEKSKNTSATSRNAADVVHFFIILSELRPTDVIFLPLLTNRSKQFLRWLWEPNLGKYVQMPEAIRISWIDVLIYLKWSVFFPPWIGQRCAVTHSF